MTEDLEATGHAAFVAAMAGWAGKLLAA